MQMRKNKTDQAVEGMCIILSCICEVFAFYNFWLSGTGSLQYRKCLKYDTVQSRSQGSSLP